MSTLGVLFDVGGSAYHVSVTHEQERWAEAVAIHRMHGDDSARWIAERIAALALARGWEGVARFQELGARLDHLLRPGGVQ